jgi:hypothetical protein
MPLGREREPMSEATRPWFEEERTYITADERQVMNLAVKYRLTAGQVRGLIARFGIDDVRLDAEAKRLRRF